MKDFNGELDNYFDEQYEIYHNLDSGMPCFCGRCSGCKVRQRNADFDMKLPLTRKE